MTIHAYREIYLSNAQAAPGDAFDYAVNTCGISGSDFVKLFVASSLSKRMEKGEPECIAGKSGIELAAQVLEETMDIEWSGGPQTIFERSVEYWIGWAVAYYQLYSGRQYDGGSD